VLASLTVRDFLQGIGYRDASVRTVSAVLRAEQNGKQLHSAGLGIPGHGQKPDERHFIGHVVAVVPSVKLLIDTTLYQVIRPAWEAALTGMVATRYGPPSYGIDVFGLHPFAGTAIERAADGYLFTLLWLDWRRNKVWRDAPDTEDWRRAGVLAELRERFGSWKDGG
jgi:hypothetical protein